jgi:uncharacterized protein YkwD
MARKRKREAIPMQALVCLAALILVANAQAPAAEADKAAGTAKHPVFWVLDSEPRLDHPKSVWLGYPSKRWVKVEKKVEARVREIRRKQGRPNVAALEELRFLGRIHAREHAARKRFDHKSDLWGYVSDRARILYGWRPVEWVLPAWADPPKHQICDNGFGGGHSAENYIGGWMSSPLHKRAILWENNRWIGMSIGGKGGMAHLVFAGLPGRTSKRVNALQPLYQALEKAEAPTTVRRLLSQIVSAKEGSAFIRIAPLLRDPDPEIRILAVKGLLGIRAAVPKAFGPIFALVDLGTASGDAEVVKESMAALRKVTGRKFETADEWRTWWHADCRSIIQKAGK